MRFNFWNNLTDKVCLRSDTRSGENNINCVLGMITGQGKSGVLMFYCAA